MSIIWESLAVRHFFFFFLLVQALACLLWSILDLVLRAVSAYVDDEEDGWGDAQEVGVELVEAEVAEC
jgi:hypothetical protein